MQVPIHKANTPAPYMPSIYANPCDHHYYETDECVSLKVSELFPSMTPAIYNYGDDPDLIEKYTRESLKNVDMSMIKPEETVNIACSEHGFTLLGGEVYTRMIQTIKAVVEERTGCYNIRLRLCMYRTPAEAKEVTEYFHLKERFDCEIIGCGPFDEGVAIETYVGRVYGIRKIFDADHFIYAYYDDPREMYVHKGQRRTFKSFMMNFARYEVRSEVHFAWGARDRMLLPQAVYDSDFIQKKWTFATVMLTAPTGLVEIMSDNDLYKIDRQSQINMTKNYQMLKELFKKAEPFISVWDGGRWCYYLHTGGMVWGTFEHNHYDFFDLDKYSNMDFDECYVKYKEGPGGLTMPASPPDLKKVTAANVANQHWIGLNCVGCVASTPTFAVGQKQIDMFRTDPVNQGYGPVPPWADLVTKVETLEEGIEKAMALTGCKNVIAFDGSFGYINCNRAAAEMLMAAADGIEELTMRKVYPRLLRQRGIDPEEVIDPKWR